MTSRVRLSAPNPEAAEQERPPPSLPNELLEGIFLRVANPVDLARASTACVAFRSLITDHTFLRRYRSIHPPLLLGFVSSAGFHPVQAPHASASIAQATARAADFSLDYLPRPTIRWLHWRLCDVRNGRILIGCRNEKGAAYWELAVCDPLSRRHLLLPPITDDLLASVDLQNQNVSHHMASFIPSGSGGALGGIEGDTSFSVILWVQSNTRLGVFVFSSVSGCWSVSMSTSCKDLGLNRLGDLVSGQCVNDCFYWKLFIKSTLIKLEMNTMRFCTVDLPPGHDGWEKIILVESGESKVVMFSLSYMSTSVYYYTFSQKGSEKSHEWQMRSIIPFTADYNINRGFMGPAEGYIFIECIRYGESSTYSTVLSLEIKSFNIERVSRTIFPGRAYPYFGFPPSMSPRRI